jgi:hypothetical protein
MKIYERKTFPLLSKSPFIFTLDEVSFHFSTARHMQKFMDNYKQNRNDVSMNLTKRWHFPTRLDLLADLYLYTQIENRGFHIIYKERVITWQGQVELSGLTLTMKD